jgi:hypothetical protein
MLARNPARFLAPVALAAVIVGGYMVVRHNLDTSSHSAQHSTTRANRDRPRGKYAHSRFYVVRPGDSLTGISLKTGVSVGKLEALNPTVNPNALQTGQRIRLRR